MRCIGRPGRSWFKRAIVIVADLMRAKPVTVRPETSLAVAAVLMLTRGLSAVMVVDEAGRLAGVLTLEDLLRRTAPGAEGSAANWLEAFLMSAHLAEDEARTLQSKRPALGV